MTDGAAAIAGVRALGFRGCAVSMPFKTLALSCVDEADSIANEIGAVNTIINSGGRLKGFNTDFSAVSQLIASSGVSPSTPALVFGAGGMARAILHALKALGFQSVTVMARKETAARELATRYGYRGISSENQVARLAEKGTFLIQATPIFDQPFKDIEIARATAVMDVLVRKSDTSFLQAALAHGVNARIDGFSITVRQAVEQFELYTGQRPSEDAIARAAAFAREGLE